MSQTLTEKAVEYVGASQEAIKQASQIVTEKQAMDAKIAELIPAAVEALAENGRIEPHEKEAAAKALTDPAKVLGILTKTAQHRTKSEESALGKPLAEKSASDRGYNSLTDPCVGRKAGSGMLKESSRRLFENLGLPAPDED